MSWSWIVLAAVITAEALLTLHGVFRFRSFFLRQIASDPVVTIPLPKVAVLAPCKGLDAHLAANIESWRSQDYSDYTIYFIVESEDDESLGVLRTVKDAKILIA
ncbi:MAG TPA: hypothetical protein VLR94_07150, partial [Acidobacteriota bacterium]|nr:hypothetical protein [Acidobacteriota bacterium]